jgi:hypothetical protein
MPSFVVRLHLDLSTSTPSDLILSIFYAKTNNFYFIENLPVTPNYYDSYLKNENLLKSDYLKFLHFNYLSFLDFDRILPFNI